MIDRWCLRLLVIRMVNWELLKMIDTRVFRLNKQLYFQFHYSYSIDSRVNMASKMHKHTAL